MKPIAIALGVTVVALVGIWLANFAFGLMNQASSIANGVGILILVALGAGVVALLAKVGKKAWAKWGDSNGEDRPLGFVWVAGIIATSALTGCTTIGPGHVGIKVDLNGDKRGVNELALTTGWVWFNLLSQKVYEYPVFVQTAVWTKDENEGSPNNEEISFNSKEGLTITGDISLSYRLVEQKVPAFYVKFWSDEIDKFTHGYLRNVARDIFNEISGKYSVEELYGPKKDIFLAEVRRQLNAQLADVGLVIEQFGFIGAPRPPQAVIDALNAKVAATQDAMKAENELRKAKAEASKRIAMAHGEAESNRILTASITGPLLQLRYLQVLENAIGKWDGKRPQVESGSGGVLIQLPANLQAAQQPPAAPAK